MGPSWMGELYLNWGYAGVLLGMFTLGIFCRTLQERLFHWNAPTPALFGACIVLYAVTKSPQGALIGPINGVVYNLPPIVIAHLLVGMFGGYHREGAPGQAGPNRVGTTGALLPRGIAAGSGRPQGPLPGSVSED